MKPFKFIIVLLSFLPLSLFSAPTVGEFVKQIDDKNLAEAYANFKKKPTRASMEAFSVSLQDVGRRLEKIRSKPNDEKGWGDADALAIEANICRMNDYFARVLEEKLIRIKASQFNFPNQEEKKPWHLRVNIQPGNGILFRDMAVSKGDFAAMSVYAEQGEVALNQAFDNDYISFRYTVFVNPEQAASIRKIRKSPDLSERYESKFFEVSRYEIIAKSMDTGECEVRFADKNLNAFISFTFYNFPAVHLD